MSPPMPIVSKPDTDAAIADRARARSRAYRQREIRDSIVRRFRRFDPELAKRRGVERGDPAAERPAPDWVWQTADAIFRRTLHLPDLGVSLVERALHWCGGLERGGHPDAHAANADRLRALIDLWPGDRAAMIDAFLTAAAKTKSCRHKPPRFGPKLRSVDVSFGAFDTSPAPTGATIKIEGEPAAVATVVRAARAMLHPPPPATVETGANAADVFVTELRP